VLIAVAVRGAVRHINPPLNRAADLTVQIFFVVAEEKQR
jgi:hypothetical protein